MAAFLVLVSVLVLAELVAGVRLVRRDRPLTPPPSRRAWSSGSLPSAPYASLL